MKIVGGPKKSVEQKQEETKIVEIELDLDSLDTPFPTDEQEPFEYYHEDWIIQGIQNAVIINYPHCPSGKSIMNKTGVENGIVAKRCF